MPTIASSDFWSCLCFEASQESNYSTQSEVAKDIKLEKNQQVMEVLGLSPFKEDKIVGREYVVMKISSVTSEMYKNLNMETEDDIQDEDKNYGEIIDHIKKFMEGKDFDSCTEVLCMIPSNWTIKKIMQEKFSKIAETLRMPSTMTEYGLYDFWGYF